MIKVFVYTGSPKGERSHTHRIIHKILHKMSDTLDIEIDAYTPHNSKISHCIGCTHCFNYGKCPLDEKDDLKVMKQKMLEADVIIFGTPIYSANVSADLKALLDRLAYWTHLLRFCGKPTMNIMTSCGNGVHLCKNYLSLLTPFLGGHEVATENINIWSEEDLDSEVTNQVVEELSKKLLASLEQEKTYSEKLNTVFKNMQNNMKFYEADPNYEYEYWKQNGLFELSCFEEVALKHKDIFEPEYS